VFDQFAKLLGYALIAYGNNPQHQLQIPASYTPTDETPLHAQYDHDHAETPSDTVARSHGATARVIHHFLRRMGLMFDIHFVQAASDCNT
jgi:hypothetical protein